MMRRLTAADQVAAFLTEEIARARWRGRLPGVDRLAEDLGVSRESVRDALLQVERAGLIERRGSGRSRLIVENPGKRKGRQGLRIAILLRERLEEEVNSSFLGLMVRVRHRLEEDGHVCIFPPKSQLDLGLDSTRIIRMVRQTKADAWLVAAGSLDLLKWFSASPLPVLAIGGRLRGLPIAATYRDPLPTIREVFRKLIEMGHRRITVISERERRQPTLSIIERTLEEELQVRGLPFGNFNVPDWEPTPAGLVKLLRQLFRFTPPTVIQVSEWATCVGVLSFLNQRGLRVPEDVSLISETTENAMFWHRPALAHLTADYEALLHHILRWVSGVSRGKPDTVQSPTPAGFEPGESIAPPKAG